MHVGVKMHSDRHGDGNMGWKDTGVVYPIPHVILQGQSPVSETSIPVMLEGKKGEKTPVIKGAAVSRSYRPLLAKSWKREKNSCASFVPAEPQGLSQVLLLLNSPCLQKLLLFLHDPI